MKINLGAGPNWYQSGWHILDYNGKNEKFKIKGNLNKINLKDKILNKYLCHTDISPHTDTNVLTEINRIMKNAIRILVPNLEKIAKAYVKKDKNFLKKP